MKYRLFTSPTILLCCSIVFLIYSCQNTDCPYTPNRNLTSSELAWISCYSNGETLTFKNELGNTLIATAGIGFDGISPQHSMEDKCDVGFQTGTSGITLINSNNYLVYHISLYVCHYYPDYPQNSNSACITCGTTYNTFKFSNYTPQNNVTINNKSYNGVYVIPVDSLGQKPEIYFWPDIWQVYYTQANGVLQFNTGGGHTWTLQ